MRTKDDGPHGRRSRPAIRGGNTSRTFAVALALGVLTPISVATDSSQTIAPRLTDDSVARFTSARHLLESAGASPAALAKFDANWNQLWPDQWKRLDDYLHRQTPSSLGDYVRQLSTASPDDRYVPSVDDLPKPGVPHGGVFDFTLDHSRIFPGTTRRIRVYIPAQYTGQRPACVFVELDDLFYLAPNAFDNLIDKHEIPPIIAIGVGPGQAQSASSPESEDPRLNRSFEFDGLNDNLARFLLEEVFPEVERHPTPNGLPIRLSNNPNDRAVGGLSTGGIGAFTLAWQRPDAFRRVFTGIGTFVGMRGGDRYPVLIRKTEPKPIRIFMQDGSNDELTDFIGEVGDWWLSNQTMQSALNFAGYQVEHVWGEGTHNSKHAVVVFPDAMRWLWKEWPNPVTAGQSQNTFLRQILEPGHGWEAVVGSYLSAQALATDPEGIVLFHDASNRETWKISVEGKVTPWFTTRRPYTDMAFGADGRAYAAEPSDGRIVAYDLSHKPSTIARGIRGANLVVTHGGAIYVTEQGPNDSGTGKLWLLGPGGHRQLLDGKLNHPTGIAISPDGEWLAVAEGKSHWGYSYRIQPDSTVQDRERFYWFHVPDEADDSGARTWIVDREGRLYAATRMGVQVFDRNGRVRAILPVPGGEVTGIAFGGVKFDTVYVSCADHKIYRRVLHTTGAQAWSQPIKLPPGIEG